MAEHRVRRLPVVKDGRLVGMVSLGAIAVTDASKRAVGQTLSGEALENLSESPSTTEIRDAPDRGTPDRVRGDRRAS